MSKMRLLKTSLYFTMMCFHYVKKFPTKNKSQKKEVNKNKNDGIQKNQVRLPFADSTSTNL